MFEFNIKKTINIIVTQSINKQPLLQFKETIKTFINEFLNPKVKPTPTPVTSNLLID